MKKHFLKSFALLAMLFSAITISAKQYCGEVMKSNIGWDGNYTLSVEKVSNTQSRLTITVADSETITGFYQFLIQNQGGGTASKQNFDPNDADFSNAELFSVAADGKSAVINVNWTTYPSSDVQIHLILRRNNSAGGSDIFGNNLTDVDFSAACGETPGEGGSDTGAPVLASVELFGAAQNYVLLTPTATDDKGVTSYLIAQSGGAESEVTPDATTGQIKVASLTLGKEYTYIVKAKDADGNVSNAKEITFSTLDNVFCEEEVLPGTAQEFANQKLTFTAKKVSDTETYFAISSSTSTLTKISTVTFYSNAGETGTYGGGVLPDGYVLKDGWTLTDNTLSKTVTWTTYPTAPFRASINATRSKNSDTEKATINWMYTMDLSNTCSEEPTPDPEETIITYTYFAPNWQPETNSSARYNPETGAITVDLKSQFNSQWQAQVKVKHDVAFSADKQYTLSCKFHATAAVGGVTIKMDDDKPVVYADQSVNLPANEDYIYTSAPSNGIAGNSQILVFDFGWAPACQITISDILIQEVEGTTPPAIEHPSPAPVPTVPAEQVFSIYSNAYPPAVNRTMGYWNQATQEQEVQLAEGDKAFYYTNCNYLGWELNDTYDMTAYPMLHMDVYVAEAGSIGFTPIWGGEAEKAYALQAGWNAIDIDLTADFAAINLATIDQLKWANMPATCYIDNVYFFNDGTTEPVEPTPVESNYCQNTLTNGANSIDLTCEKVSVGNYRIIIEGSNLGQNGMDNATSGSFIIVNNEKTENITKGSLLKQYINTTLSTTSKVICEVPSTVDPKFDGNLYIMMPGEVNFGAVSDVIWGTCPEAEEDTQAPTMTSATVESYTHNSAVIAVVAEDNVGVAKYQIVDAGNGVDQTLTATDGKIALSGLASATTYNLTIYAIDKAGNKSAGLAVAAFTTDALVYCDFPTGNNGDANFGNPDGRILVSLIKITPQNVRVVVKSADAATKNLDLIYIEAAGANPHATTVGADAASSDLRVMSADISYPTIPAKYSFMIQWSNPDWDGRWQINLNDVLESNLCPLPTDDEAPVMVSASLVTGSETYNSAVLTVSATDNDEVANYHVVDAANNYNKTIAPVGNQITLTDLTPSTTYNFTVTALDLAGNESENSKTVAVSTHKLEYCEWIIGSENRADWTDANRLCLLTISKITDKQLLVVAKPVSGANKLDFLQVQAEGAPHQTVTSPAADELSIVLDFANTITEIPLFRILWSNEDIVENWMTDLKNVKASYLCPHIELGESVDLSKLDISTAITTDVKITRKFVTGSNKWNTLSLPFALTESEIDDVFGTAARVVELTGATKTTPTDLDLTVSSVANIVAGKPYLIQLPASYAPVVLEDVILGNVAALETETANGMAKMVSVLTPIAFDDAAGGIRFFLNTNGKLSYRSTTNGIMNPYRAYFVFPHINDPATAAQVRARVVFNENEATGLDQIVAPEGETIKAIVNGQLIIIRGGVKYNVQGQKL